MSFVLELDNFQGPFDLLLKLLDQQKLEITDISLSKITDDYLDYINNLELTIDEMNSFLYVAAKLSLDKSRAIIDIPSSEEDEIDLTESLKQYQKIKDQARILSELSNNPMKSRAGNIYRVSSIAKIPKDELNSAYKTIIRAFKNSRKTHRINNKKNHIDLAKTKFNNQVMKLKSFSLDEIMTKPADRTEAIVFFLSILELLKNQKLAQRNNEIIEVLV